MKISVIGVGYLGAVHAASMAELGHEVIGLDVDTERIQRLGAGQPPFHEPGFEEILRRGIETGDLRFTTDYADLADVEVHFLGLGTPQRADGMGADLSYLHAAVDSLLEVLPARRGQDTLVVGKSTVPAGTARALADRIEAVDGARLMWNPEFLREGFAVQDTIAPDRIVYGVRDEDAARAAGAEEPGRQVDPAPEVPGRLVDPAREVPGRLVDPARAPEVALLDAVYARILETGVPRLVMGFETAELVKVSANAFLATKISFINAIAEICEATGADVTDISRAIGMDDRIGSKFLRAGVGFGGGCLPKDIRAFIASAEDLGVGEALGFLREVDELNERRRVHVVDIAREMLGGLEGRRIAVLGAAFKPDSDDVRDSPALDVANQLQVAGAEVVVTDPEALDNAARRAPHLRGVADLEEALTGAELVVLLTEWRQYRGLDPASVASCVAAPRLIDGRNVLPLRAWREAGWEVRALGRP